MAVNLYTWQQSCIKAWLEHQSRGIVQVVTGAGKTILALYAARALQQRLQKKLNIVIIVPKTFLIGQWKSNLLSHQKELGISRNDIGWVHGNHHQPHTKPIMLYVVNSARYSLSTTLHSLLSNDEPVLVIADECHHYASEENRKIFSFLSALDAEKQCNYYALGLSATPMVNGFSQYLVPNLGPLFFTYGFNEAMQDQVINQAVIYNIELTMTEEQSEQYDELSGRISSTLRRLNKAVPYLKKLKGSAFFLEIQHLCTSKEPSIADTANALLAYFHQRRALVYEAPQRIACTLDLIALLESRSKIIIFGERISQSEELYDILKRRYPNQVVQYHSELGETARTLALERYRSGEARIMVSCKALDEGLDIPSADVGILLATTSEQRQRVQRLGRILRRQSGKGKASLFYLEIGETVEERELLEEGIELVEEWHLTYTDHFIHPVYDELATTFYHALQKQKADLYGIKQILDKGRVRNDWIEDPSILAKHTTRYYSCMRSLSLLRSRM